MNNQQNDTGTAALYTTARSEVVAHFKLKDQLLLACLVASGAIVGIGQYLFDDIPGLLLLIPLLGLGISILVSCQPSSVG